MINMNPRLYMDGGDGGGGGAAPSQTQTTTAELPEWARGYAKDTLYNASQLTDINQNPYKQYEAPRIAGFSPMQQQAMQGAANMGPASQLGTGTDLATAAGMGALGANYQAGQFGNQFQAPGQYQPGQFSMSQVEAPNLQNFQMDPAERVRTQSFNRPGSAEAYMSPYMQNVVDIQKREAQRQSGIQGTQQQAQAVGAGAFGGSRDAIMRAERERNLGQQMGDIQATGQQAAFQNAQQQFNAEQQARLQAQLANQQAGLTVGGQNLGAKLGVQQLGAGQNLQAQLANQQAFQQAQRDIEQSRQFGSGQGLQAAGLGAQYGLAGQQLGEQSRQYGAGLGMQGLQTGLQAAGQLGQLGQTQYGQQMGINQLQSQYGGQQQALAQQNLSQSYQDFLNQQNYPYKQLGFMSDMIRGLPLGQQSAQSIYQAPPSSLQTIGALGMGAYGASKLFGSKEGGLMKSYAAGGVTSQQNVEGILDKLSDAQLKQAKEAALNRRDIEQAQMIDAEIAQRASVRNGLGGAFNQIPQEQQEGMMAGGGIVAFAGKDGSVVEDTDNQSRVTPENMQEILDELKSEEDEGGAGGSYANQLNREILNESKALDKLGTAKPMTTQEQMAQLAIINKALRDQAGTDTGYDAFSKQLKDIEASGEKRLNEGRGLAALAAIPAMLEGNNAVRGIGGAGGAFAGAYGQYVNAANKEKLSLAQMKYNLADSKRKENLGLTKDAVSLMDSARRAKMDADRFAVDKSRAKSMLLGKGANLNKPTKGATPNFDINAQAAIAEDLRSITPKRAGESDAAYDARINAAAFRQILEAKGTKDITSRGTVTSNQTRDIVSGGAEAGAKADTVATELAKQQEKAVADVKKSIPYLQAMKAKDSTAMQKMENDARAGVVSGFEKSRQQVNSGAKPAAPAVQPLPANPTADTLKDGVVYITPRGNAKWNATTQKFTPVP